MSGKQELYAQSGVERETASPMGELREMSVTYPQIVGLLNQNVQSKLNQRIIETARRTLPNPNEGNIVEAQSGYRTTVQYNNILSLRFQNYYFAEYNAHGMTYVKSITANTQTGQVYQLSDLFNPAIHWQAILTQLIIEQIIARRIPLLQQYRGIQGNEEFYLTPNALIIYYPIYEYTPYYYGILEFTIPYTQISQIINPLGPIGLLLRPVW